MRSCSRLITLFALMGGSLTFSLNGQQVIPNRSAQSSSSSTPSSAPHPTLSSSRPQTPATASTTPASGYSTTGQGLLPSYPSKYPAIPTPVSGNLVPAYFHPGILIQRGSGQWEGGDHLFNLTNNIGVYVEFVKSQGDRSIQLNQEEVQKLVEKIFTDSGITPTTLGTINQPPLPFFQLQIMIYPINRGYVACCSGRLFESILLRRIEFDPGMTFQAITWEKESLLVAPTEALNAQLEKSIIEIAQSFGERFQAFEQRRRDILGDKRRF